MPLTITIKSDGGWDEILEEFTDPFERTIVMEHSLVSLQKWEAIWQTPYLSLDPERKLTIEQTISYYQCMTITQNVDPEIYKFLTASQQRTILEYINNPMTATTIKEDPNKKKKANREVQTAETIYAAMCELQIPSEYRKWHLNQLLMLIQVCAIRQQPGEKMDKKTQYAQNRALNKARRAKHGSKG